MAFYRDYCRASLTARRSPSCSKTAAGKPSSTAAYCWRRGPAAPLYLGRAGARTRVCGSTSAGTRARQGPSSSTRATAAAWPCPKRHSPATATGARPTGSRSRRAGRSGRRYANGRLPSRVLRPRMLWTRPARIGAVADRLAACRPPGPPPNSRRPWRRRRPTPRRPTKNDELYVDEYVRRLNRRLDGQPAPVAKRLAEQQTAAPAPAKIRPRRDSPPGPPGLGYRFGSRVGAGQGVAGGAGPGCRVLGAGDPQLHGRSRASARRRRCGGRAGRLPHWRPGARTRLAQGRRRARARAAAAWSRRPSWAWRTWPRDSWAGRAALACCDRGDRGRPASCARNGTGRAASSVPQGKTSTSWRGWALAGERT